MINAGVSGDTSTGGLSRIEWTLGANPDALIVLFGGNDLLRGTEIGLVRSNLTGILDAADEQGVPTLLVGIEAPSNYGLEYKTRFEAIFPELRRNSEFCSMKTSSQHCRRRLICEPPGPAICNPTAFTPIGPASKQLFYRSVR